MAAEVVTEQVQEDGKKEGHLFERSLGRCYFGYGCDQAEHAEHGSPEGERVEEQAQETLSLLNY